MLPARNNLLTISVGHNFVLTGLGPSQMFVELFSPLTQANLASLSSMHLSTCSCSSITPNSLQDNHVFPTKL